MNFSEKTLAALKKAGWYEGYRFDASNYIRILEDCQFEVSDAVRQFLTNFGGLTIEYFERYSDGTIGPRKARFNTEVYPSVARSVYSYLQQYKEFTGVDACVVGLCRDIEMGLFMDGDGKLYTEDDDGFYLVGKTIEEGFDNLIDDREFKLLYEFEEVPYVPRER